MHVCFGGLCVVLITAGLRLFFNCITTCVLTCDACAPHVIHLLAISCNSLVLYHGGFKHDDKEDRKCGEGHHRGTMAMATTTIQKAIPFTV